MITAAPDTTLTDGREVCVIRARDLQVGDVLVRHESIDLTITSVRRYDEHLFVVIGYACTAGIGQRTLVASSFVSIKPRVETEGSVH